jgi:hypothetical protein
MGHIPDQQGGPSRTIWIGVAVAALVLGGVLLTMAEGADTDSGQTAVSPSCEAVFDRAVTEAEALTGEDQAVRSTVRQCRDYAMWLTEAERRPAAFGKTSLSGNEIRSLCVFEPTSPVCRDAEERGVL